jgi:Flp pilus assembly protein TadG
MQFVIHSRGIHQMIQPISKIITHFTRLRRNRRGSVAVTIAILMPVLIGMSGLAIDVGHVILVKRELQASADAAALAGGRELNCCQTSIAVSTATTYSAAWQSSTVMGSNKNAMNNVYVQMASGYPQLKCFSSIGISCTGTDSANGLVVRQTATVPMWFASIFGVKSIPVTATATASGIGGIAQKLDIDFVVDTTASMGGSDPACSVTGATRIGCALAGMNILIGELQPSADYIGILAFPGLSSTTQQSKDWTCPTSNPTTTAYKNVPTTTTAGQPTYQILAMANDFKTTNTTTAPLNPNSKLVIAVGGSGISNCKGVGAPGGYGTFYADAITAAQNDLTTNGRSGIQKVIVLLSDGDANASSTNMTTAKKNQQCHEAITAANTATTAGIWVYTIAYGAPTSSSCSTDTSPTISACTTMKTMASDLTKFYSDDAAGCVAPDNSLTDLIQIFKYLGASFQTARLLPDNTT